MNIKFLAALLTFAIVILSTGLYFGLRGYEPENANSEGDNLRGENAEAAPTSVTEVPEAQTGGEAEAPVVERGGSGNTAQVSNEVAGNALAQTGEGAQEQRGDDAAEEENKKRRNRGGPVVHRSIDNVAKGRRLTEEELKAGLFYADGCPTFDLTKVAAVKTGTYTVEGVTVTVTKQDNSTAPTGYEEYEHTFNKPVKLTNTDANKQVTVLSDKYAAYSLCVYVKLYDRRPLLVKVTTYPTVKTPDFDLFENDGRNRWTKVAKPESSGWTTKLEEIFEKVHKAELDRNSNSFF